MGTARPCREARHGWTVPVCSDCRARLLAFIAHDTAYLSFRSGSSAPAAKPQRSFGWVSERDGSFRHQKDGASRSRPADTGAVVPLEVSKGSFLAGSVFLLPERCDPVTRVPSGNEPSDKSAHRTQHSFPENPLRGFPHDGQNSALLQVGVRTGRFRPAPKRRCLPEPSR